MTTWAVRSGACGMARRCSWLALLALATAAAAARDSIPQPCMQHYAQAGCPELLAFDTETCGSRCSQSEVDGVWYSYACTPAGAVEEKRYGGGLGDEAGQPSVACAGEPMASRLLPAQECVPGARLGLPGSAHLSCKVLSWERRDLGSVNDTTTTDTTTTATATNATTDSSAATGSANITYSTSTTTNGTTTTTNGTTTTTNCTSTTTSTTTTASTTTTTTTTSTTTTTTSTSTTSSTTTTTVSDTTTPNTSTPNTSTPSTTATSSTSAPSTTTSQRTSSLTLTSAADATLIEVAADDPPASSDVFSSCFVGTNGEGLRRRSLLYFDLSILSASSVVQDATLTIRINRAGSAPDPRTVTVHEVVADWHEGGASGNSNPGAGSGGGGSGGPAVNGSTTWLHRDYPQLLWDNPGGDYDPTVLASAVSNGGVNTDLNFLNLTVLVQRWLANPDANFGLLLKLANESVAGSALRFDSREATAGVKPALVVTLAPEGSTTSSSPALNTTQASSTPATTPAPTTTTTSSTFSTTVASTRTAARGQVFVRQDVILGPVPSNAEIATYTVAQVVAKNLGVSPAKVVVVTIATVDESRRAAAAYRYKMAVFAQTDTGHESATQTNLRLYLDSYVFHSDLQMVQPSWTEVHVQLVGSARLTTTTDVSPSSSPDGSNKGKIAIAVVCSVIIVTGLAFFVIRRRISGRKYRRPHYQDLKQNFAFEDVPDNAFGEDSEL